MTHNSAKINWLFIFTLLFFLRVCYGCKSKKEEVQIEESTTPIGIIESDILKMEGYIPTNLSDTNHVIIWRGGSIYYSEYLSALIIEKKQLKDNQLLCHYMTFDPNKPSNYRNWKYANIYELTLENSPFKFPLNIKTSFSEVDSSAFECNCEGIEANVYFMKEFSSNEVFIINDKYNSEFVDDIVKLFTQISKKEHIQTFSLTQDTIDYQQVYTIIKEGENTYCINEDGTNSMKQRHYGDK